MACEVPCRSSCNDRSQVELCRGCDCVLTVGEFARSLPVEIVVVWPAGCQWWGLVGTRKFGGEVVRKEGRKGDVGKKGEGGGCQ